MKKLVYVVVKEKFGDKFKLDGNGWYYGLCNFFCDGVEKLELEGYEGMVFVVVIIKM